MSKLGKGDPPKDRPFIARLTDETLVVGGWGEVPFERHGRGRYYANTPHGREILHRRWIKDWYELDEEEKQ